MPKRGLLWVAVDKIIFIGVIGMFITVLLQITTRLLGHSLPWTEELTRNLFILIVFLGMASGFRSAEHTRITFMLKLIPKKLKKIQLYIYFFSDIIFFVLLAYQGFFLSLRQFRSGEFSPALGLPMYFVTISICIGAVLAIIALVQSVFIDKSTQQQLMNGDYLGGDEL